MEDLLARLDDHLICRSLVDNPALRLALPVPLIAQRPLAATLSARLDRLLATPSPGTTRLSAAVDQVFARAVDESARLDGVVPGVGDADVVAAWFDAFAAELLACFDAGDPADESACLQAATAVADRFARSPSPIVAAGER